MNPAPRILYCHCQYAQVLPKESKEAVLKHLCEKKIPFDAVADLCELSARKDPILNELASGGGVKIVACFPRAVRWLFSAAGAPLDPGSTQVCNLRSETAQSVMDAVDSPDLHANIPAGQAMAADSPSAQSNSI